MQTELHDTVTPDVCLAWISFKIDSLLPTPSRRAQQIPRKYPKPQHPNHPKQGEEDTEEEDLEQEIEWMEKTKLLKILHEDLGRVQEILTNIAAEAFEGINSVKMMVANIRSGDEAYGPNRERKARAKSERSERRERRERQRVGSGEKGAKTKNRDNVRRKKREGKSAMAGTRSEGVVADGKITKIDKKIKSQQRRDKRKAKRERAKLRYIEAEVNAGRSMDVVKHEDGAEGGSMGDQWQGGDCMMMD